MVEINTYIFDSILPIFVLVLNQLLDNSILISDLDDTLWLNFNTLGQNKGNDFYKTDYVNLKAKFKDNFIISSRGKIIEERKEVTDMILENPANISFANPQTKDEKGKARSKLWFLFKNEEFKRKLDSIKHVYFIDVSFDEHILNIEFLKENEKDVKFETYNSIYLNWGKKDLENEAVFKKINAEQRTKKIELRSLKLREEKLEASKREKEKEEEGERQIKEKVQRQRKQRKERAAEQEEKKLLLKEINDEMIKTANKYKKALLETNIFENEEGFNNYLTKKQNFDGKRKRKSLKKSKKRKSLKKKSKKRKSLKKKSNKRKCV